MITTSFPEPPVNGIHVWVMTAAWHCRKSGMTASEAMERIYSYAGSLRRRLQPKEVPNAVEKVYRAKLGSFASFRSPAELPDWNSQETARILAESGIKVDDLLRESPVKDPASCHPHDILERLFPDSEGLLCIAESSYRFLTAPLHDHDRLEQKQFIVPAFMLSVHGETQDGRRSMHCKSNTGPRRFIVCDFDSPPPEQHPAIILHLARFRPLTMALSSGGKGLHAWFPVTDSAQDDRLFWRLCIALGADPALYRNPSQFVRMPNGTRDNGKIQSVVYFNPAAQP